jgi:serine phosphatase RsbU (regulator of sigma subunit)/Tfp pilus assembly protein PilF
MLIRIPISFFLFFTLAVFGQNRYVDSLELRLKSANDTEKVIIYTKLVSEYSTNNPPKSAECAEIALKLAEKSGNPALLFKAYTAKSTIYTTQSNFDGALEMALKANEIAANLKDPSLIAHGYVSLGYVYLKLHNDEKALDYFKKALALETSITDKRILGNLLNNMGNTFYALQQFDSALVYHTRALEIREKINDQRGISYSYNNIGNVFIEKKDADKALEYYFKSLAIKEEIGDTKGISSGYINISEVYRDLKNYKRAFTYAERGVKVAESIRAKDWMINGYLAAAEACKGLEDYKLASDYYQKLIALKDSLYNENTTNKIAEMQTKYDSEKSQQQLAIANEQNARKDLYIGAAIISVLVLIVLVVLSYRNYTQKKITNEKLSETNMIIERKNKDITDSIKYALRIQKAILPDTKLMQESIPDHFIYYNPRDIVSGDFYWFHRFDNKLILASADCTGHGVPGAFMSMICVQLLNQVVNDSKIHSPQLALASLDEGVKTSLHQGAIDSSTDGMDIALCEINLDKRSIQYSGAFRPLYLVRKGELIEYAANKFTIGGHIDREKKFNGHSIDLEQGDCVYLFTDGFPDQFGGQNGKKFMLKNFKKLLLDIWMLPMSEQRKKLDAVFLTWKGQFEQVDDILVMGMKV